MSYDEHYSNYYTYDLGNMLLPNALIEEVERVSKEREDLLGLEECYKKVCKVSHNMRGVKLIGRSGLFVFSQKAIYSI